MFGWVANTLDKNVIIVLSVTAAILLVAGLCLAITSPPAKAQSRQRNAPAKASQAHTTAVTAYVAVSGAVRFIDHERAR